MFTHVLASRFTFHVFRILTDVASKMNSLILYKYHFNIIKFTQLDPRLIEHHLAVIGVAEPKI